MSWPAYLDFARSGELARRMARAQRLLRSCVLCPRRCRVDRLEEVGVCGTGRLARVAGCGPHHGEERCLSGTGGSGTIFFSGCNLGCLFCQNWDISHATAGEEVDANTLAGLMLDLQGMGCHNINLVTPSHVVPQVLEALPLAVEGGLRLPLVYNTSAYDSLATLRLLDGVVDIYMPDFKYWTAEAGERFLTARDYAGTARRAIAEMHRQAGDLVIDPHGLACRGVLVRHLVMPGGLSESERILAWLAQLSPHMFVNLMPQYRPQGRVQAESERLGAIARCLTSDEFREALRLAVAAGLSRAQAA
jgi:putative pyruvate formate lyase activating enzyme